MSTLRNLRCNGIFYSSTILLCSILLSSCALTPTQQPNVTLSPASYNQLPGWMQDQQQQALPALQASCGNILKRAEKRHRNGDPRGSTAWTNSCDRILQLPQNASTAMVRQTIMQTFTPYMVTTSQGINNGLFTGYYEPIVAGSLTQTPYYSVPIYGLPKTLKVITFEDGSKQSMWKQNGHYQPLPTRAQIAAGKRLPNTPVLAWVHDQVDRYFMQVQGSGSIKFADGTKMLLGYAGQNGQPYEPIGIYLMQNNYIPAKQVSMQSIRQWLATHPAQVQTVLNTDPSFVFFRKVDAPNPLGAEGVPLTPGRSLAVDPSYVKLGTPIWLDSYYPTKNNNMIVPGAPLQRLMVAQDTGGAIDGPIRADIFWGNSPAAIFYAGHMQSPGRYWVLLPKGLNPNSY